MPFYILYITVIVNKTDLYFKLSFYQISEHKKYQNESYALRED